MATSAHANELPTVLNPETCIRKGLCPIGRSRGLPTFNLYYELHGSLDATKKMVFIMGFNNTCFGWSNQVDHFGRQPDHAVLVFDNRGVGNSDVGPNKLFKTSEMAHDVVDLLDFIRWKDDRSIHVIGVSMGGMIAQELCLLIPKRIISVVFTSTKAGERFEAPSVSTGVTLFRSIFRKAPPEERISILLTRLFPAEWLDAPASDGSGKTNREIRHATLLHHLNTRRPQTLPGVLGQLAAVATHYCSPEALKRLSEALRPAKMVVLTGRKDDLLPADETIRLHSRLVGAELVVYEDCGHAICSQVPERHDQLLERVMGEGSEAIARS